MTKFTVIGLYEDNHQPYAHYFNAVSAAEAAKMAIRDTEDSGTGFYVAGVVYGHVAVMTPEDVNE